MPVLKWVRGEPLSQDHWLELFRLLKMPKGTTLEKLNFGHILAAADNIIANADAVKVSVISDMNRGARKQVFRVSNQVCT